MIIAMSASGTETEQHDKSQWPKAKPETARLDPIALGATRTGDVPTSTWALVAAYSEFAADQTALEWDLVR